MKKFSTTIFMLLLATLFVFPVHAAPQKVTEIIPMISGETTKLTFRAKGVKKNKIKWMSSNKSVITVNKKGKVEAKNPGVATIIAKYRDKRKRFIIVVNPRPEEPQKPETVEPAAPDPTPGISIIAGEPSSPTYEGEQRSPLVIYNSFTIRGTTSSPE